MIRYFSKTRANYPLLHRLFVLQLGVFVLGVLLAVVASYLIQKFRLDSRLTESKERLRTAIYAKQESLRAWKQMGLDDAVDAALKPIRDGLPGSVITVLHRTAMGKLDDLDVVVPETDDGLSPFVVRGQLPRVPYGPFSSMLEGATIFWIAALYLAVILFQLYYVQKHFYSPLSHFEDELSKQRGRDSVDIGKIPAKGEILRFLEAFKASVDKTLLAERQATLVEVSTRLAHDIRSPLTALQHLQPTFEKLAKREADLVQQIINRINQIVESLLVARRNEIAVEQTFEPFLTNLLSQKQLEWSKKKIAWKLDCGKGLCFRANAKLVADLERSLSNLINNAAEAIDGTGSIEVTAKRQNGKIEITVADTGKGIDEKILTELGARPTISDKKDGNGLGVWYAKRFAEAFGGTLRISSQIGKGTQVSLTLGAG